MCLLNVREHLFFYPLVCPKQKEKLPHVTSASTNRGMYKSICEISDALLMWRRVFSAGQCSEEDGVFVGRV